MTAVIILIKGKTHPQNIHAEKGLILIEFQIGGGGKGKRGKGVPVVIGLAMECNG